MKKYYLSIILFLFYIFPLLSQNSELSFLTIPDSLKTDANAVIRLEITNIDIQSSSKMIIKKEMTVTILNKLGDNDGHIYLYYDNNQKIKSVHVKIYDAFGNEIDRIKRSDFKDVSAVGNGSLYSDDKVIYYKHIPKSYPYTIKYDYEISTSNTAFIPNWIPVKHFYASTEKSKYTINSPEGITINYIENNLNHYNVESNNSKNSISYTLSNAKAIAYETLSPIFYYYGPHVKFAVNKFNLAGVHGEANNWKEFGQWMNDKLLAGRSELSETTKLEIQGLVKGIDDPVERARIVYEYMQNKTRYISVQIGIGGWQPMLAQEVEKLGYGDCKALTNYTQSLLKAADVNSYYTILYAKERRNIDKELASIQGNHAILMLPMKKDTIWLECTSQKVPFGYLGSFTDDRDVLIVTPQGGKIVRTKSYSNSENKQVISGEISLENNGNIKGKIKIASSGVQYDDNYPIADMDTKERDSYYKEFFDNINNIQLNRIDVSSDEKNTIFQENIEFIANNYSVNSGNKMLFRINVLNVNDNIPKRIRNRKLPLEIKYGYLDEDNIIINLPKNYQIEAMANSKKLESKFGAYNINIEKINEHQIKYTRELLIKQGIYSVSDYDAYRKFIKKISQLDNSKIVLIKT